MSTLRDLFQQALPRVYDRYLGYGHGQTGESVYRRVPDGGFLEWSSFEDEVKAFASQTVNFGGDSGIIFNHICQELGFATNEECVQHSIYAHWTGIVSKMGEEINRRNPGCAGPCALGEASSCVLQHPCLPDFVFFVERPEMPSLFLAPVEVKPSHLIRDDTDSMEVIMYCNSGAKTNIRLAFTQLCGQIMGNGSSIRPDRGSLRFGLGYGILTNYNSCWFAKVVHDHTTNKECMYISRCVDCTQIPNGGIGFYNSLWFILNKMVVDKEPSIPRVYSRRNIASVDPSSGNRDGAGPSGVGEGIDTREDIETQQMPERQILTRSALTFTPETEEQMISRLNTYAAGVCARRQIALSELEPFYSGMPVDNEIEMIGSYIKSPNRKVNVVRGLVRGIPAIIKFGDTTKYIKCIEDGLWETYIYKKLSELQGIYIPKMAVSGTGFAMAGMSFVWTLLDGGGISLGEDPTKAAVQALEQALVCLTRIHDAGVVHGDLHQGNIVVLPDGSVHIIDFGKSRVTRDQSLQQEDRKILEDMIAAAARRQVTS